MDLVDLARIELASQQCARLRCEASAGKNALVWWTYRESNSGPGNANAVYYHCTIGPHLRLSYDE